MQKSLLATVMLFVAAQIALSQNWALTNAGTNDWFCVGASANGSTLIAGQWPGYLGVSTNAGATWTTNVMTNGYWASVASSADGTKLLAAAPNFYGVHSTGVFLSTNSGVTWTSNSLPNYYWSSVAMSADGNTLAAVAPFDSGSSMGFVQAVFCSTNAGINWVSNNTELTKTVGPASAVSVAMSADGRKIFVIASPLVCYSTDFGASWMVMSNAPSLGGWSSPSQLIASSADGNRLILVEGANGQPNLICTSTNSGETWSPAPVPGGAWSFVSSSADGKTLMTAANGLEIQAPLFISTNSGASWTSDRAPNGYWTGLACSADGGALVTVAAADTNFDMNSGAIYLSQSIQSPLLNIAPAGSELQLSWLIPSTDFVLEQSADLLNWSVVKNAPALNLANLNEQILVSPTNGVGFYRLVTP